MVTIVGLVFAINEGFRKIPLKIWLPILLLLVALGIAVGVSPDKRTALGEFKGFFIDPLLVFWLVWQFVKKEKLHWIFGGLALSSLFVSVHTIVQKLLGHLSVDGRVIGIFGYSPNYTALFLAPLTVMAIGWLVYLMVKKNYSWAFANVLIVLLNLAAIYFSGSRGGFLAVLAGAAIFFIAYFWPLLSKKLYSKLIVIVLVLLAIFAAWFLFKPDFSATAGRVSTSNNIRWHIWETTIKLGKAHSLTGVGLGNFQNAFASFTNGWPNYNEYITPMAFTPHNIFLMYWLTTGVLGLIAFIWLIVIFLIETIKNRQKEYMPLILAVLASIIAYGLIETSMFKNDLSVIFFLFWGLAWVI